MPTTKSERTRVGDRVTIYRRGKNQIYCADFWHEGQHRRATLKTSNKKVALKRATKIASQLDDGTFAKPIKAASLESAIDAYITFCRTEGRAKGSVDLYQGKLSRLKEFCFEQGVRHLSGISATLFDRYRAERKASLDDVTMYHEAVVIKQFLKWCAKRKLVRENPLADFKVTKPTRPKKAVPTFADVWAILNASDDQTRLPLAMLAFTGARCGEIRRARVEDVDVAGNWFHIVSRPGAETKTGQTWKVPIHPVLHEMLAKQPAPTGDFFFPPQSKRAYRNARNQINTVKLNDEFQRIAGSLGMPVGRKSGYTLHALRRFFETHTVNNGIPQRVIDSWLGHNSDKSMAAVYYRLSDEDSQAFMSKVPFQFVSPAVAAGP